jgi:hypothetical protein
MKNEMDELDFTEAEQDCQATVSIEEGRVKETTGSNLRNLLEGVGHASHRFPCGIADISAERLILGHCTASFFHGSFLRLSGDEVDVPSS